ncbi:hypothetical protein LguiB_027007 [Lonicera macranthoides]
MGKPNKIIYKSAMEMAGVEEASECIAVGDSLHHDIKGANVAGIQSAFITGRIHANELGLSKFGQVLADPSSLHELTSKFDAYPSYVLPSFTCSLADSICSHRPSSSMASTMRRCCDRHQQNKNRRTTISQHHGRAFSELEESNQLDDMTALKNNPAMPTGGVNLKIQAALHHHRTSG